MADLNKMRDKQVSLKDIGGDDMSLLIKLYDIADACIKEADPQCSYKRPGLKKNPACTGDRTDQGGLE